MDREFEPRFSLAELVEATGVAARTVRYYIDRELMPRAEGKGRYAYYTAEHVEALARIRELRQRSLSLEEMREILIAERSPGPATPAGATWTRLSIHPDLELHVRNGAPENVSAFVHQVQLLAVRWFEGAEDGDEPSDEPPWT